MSDKVQIEPELLDEAVGELIEAIPLLRRPFTPDAVLWKVQASFQECESALIVPYIDARLAAERLDTVCGPHWQQGHPESGLAPFQEVSGGLLSNITLFGVPRFDVGSGYSGNTKGLYSDAFKRAAVKWGVGRSLYAFPKTILRVDQGSVLDKRTIRTKKGLKTINVLTADGFDHMRQVYRAWLEETGIPVFGQPLDHGDRGIATGDPEAEGAAGADLLDEDERESEHSKRGKEGLEGSIRERAKGGTQ